MTAEERGRPSGKSPSSRRVGFDYLANVRPVTSIWSIARRIPKMHSISANMVAAGYSLQDCREIAGDYRHDLMLLGREIEGKYIASIV